LWLTETKHRLERSVSLKEEPRTNRVSLPTSRSAHFPLLTCQSPLIALYKPSKERALPLVTAEKGSSPESLQGP
jgi:hypothetical protein